MTKIMSNMKELTSFSKTLKVLYVEDNENARVQMLKMLDNFFTDVTVAVDGKEGLDKFNQDDYHLVITDINMPNKNGIDMLKEIKILDDEVFCLIISAYNESDYFMDAIELGVDGFLLKPVKIDQFLALLLKTIKRIKNIQEVKELNEKQARLSSLGEMMDAVAHQWKQPLSMITLIPSTLMFKIQTGEQVTNDEVQECSAKINEQINHLTQTLDDFRKFFRLNTKTETVYVKQLIDSVLNLMKITLIKDSININLKCDETIAIDIIENEFKHIFINLINNSKDAYCVLNKDIQKTVNIDVFENDDKIIIEYCDNAGGIPDSVIDKVFDSNFTTKKEGKGTGVGLYMTKQIIEKIGGSIEVENIDNGVCFRLSV